MKHTFKINFKINGKYSFSVFIMDTKEQLADKIAQWKAEHINPYNKVEILWFGTLEAWEEEQKSVGLCEHIRNKY
jgi:hypothetical protein